MCSISCKSMCSYLRIHTYICSSLQSGLYTYCHIIVVFSLTNYRCIFYPPFRVYGFLKLISIFQVRHLSHIQCKCIPQCTYCSYTPPHVQYCNVYVPMPEVQLLLTNQQLCNECLDYVALPGLPCHVYRHSDGNLACSSLHF